LNPIPFSVILPVYGKDHPDFFRLALNSLAQQTRLADEVVVVADGPLTPALEDVLMSTPLPGLKVIRLPENRGLSAALNAGIASAQHEWLARMDADDICLPHRFETQWNYLNEHPDISILGAWIREFTDDPNQPQGERRGPETHAEILRFARWRCPFNHMTVVYRKSALLQLGCYKDYGAVGDDYELWARFLMGGYRAGIVPEVLVLARTGQAFFTHRRRGWRYLRNEWREIDDLRAVGLINRPTAWVHKMAKSVVRLGPAGWVKRIYALLRT
jgi:GT2 family glycosyltransferase